MNKPTAVNDGRHQAPSQSKKVERVQVRGKPIKVSDFVSPFFDDDDELDALIASAAAAAQARGDTLLHGLLTAVEPAEGEE